jgi:hypothetical protein
MDSMSVDRAQKPDAPGKYDVSNRSHDEIFPSPISTLDRFLIPLSGIPVDFAYEHGKPQELSDLRALGIVLLGSSLLSAITTTVGLHLAMGAGGFHPLYLLAGVFVGTLTGAIDHVVQYKGTLGSRGLAENRRVGLKLPDPETATHIPFLVRLFRVGQAATFGFLGGTFLFIAANFSDVHSYIDNKFMTANRAVAEEAAKLVDGGISRSKQALAVQDGEIGNLIRSIQTLRSSDVRRATGRKGIASPSSNPQLDALERRLSDTTATRDKLAAVVSKQEAGRNAAIEEAINESPNAVRKRTGLAAQLEAISAFTAEDPKLLLIVLAFEFLSLALELGPMWAAATKIPSALAARLALDHFIDVTSLATKGAERLGVHRLENHEAAEPAAEQAAAAADIPALPKTEAAPIAANDNLPASPSGLNGAAWLRRPRGRPRKNGADRPMEEPGHE